MASIAALGPLVAQDIRERRWFQPMANFGQLTISAAIAGMVIDVGLRNVGIASRNDLAAIAVAGTVASLAYTIVNWQLVLLAVRVVYRKRDVLPWSKMPVVLASLLVMGVVGGLLGATMVLAQPAVSPLILIVYLIGHLSLSSFQPAAGGARGDPAGVHQGPRSQGSLHPRSHRAGRLLLPAHRRGALISRAPSSSGSAGRR